MIEKAAGPLAPGGRRNGASGPVPASRTADATRQALIEAATTVFADEGFAAGSVRSITRKAGANQAAITYHFGGKDGLYQAVLQAGIDAFETESLIDERTVTEEDRGEALRIVIRQFFIPLTQPGRLGRFIRIFGREGIDPESGVYGLLRHREAASLSFSGNSRAALSPDRRRRAGGVGHYILAPPAADRVRPRCRPAPPTAPTASPSTRRPSSGSSAWSQSWR